MKKTMFGLICILSSSFAVASSSFKGEDFNAMIKDNQKAESELRNKLQKEAGIRFDDKPGTLDKDRFVPNTETEQIVVSTTDHSIVSKKARTYNKVDETTASQRLSQEFKDAN